MTRLFQDFRVPQKLTSDGSPQFMSDKLQSCLRQYGLHQRLTSVGFAHANTRAELGVKSEAAKGKCIKSPLQGHG